MLTVRGILCIWAFAVLARAQGMLGGKQYPPCNSSISQGAQYIGCYDLSKEVEQLQISGTDPTLYSYYPGWIENGDPTAAALFDNSITPDNCTIACRGHGYKYAALYGGVACRCMGNAPSTLAPLSSTNPQDPATMNSCHVPGQYIPGNCPGDSSQFCGTGTYADVYVDNSFPLLSTINPNVEDGLYSYIGCFHPGGGGNVNVGQLSYRVPATNVSGATSMTPCFEFCATLGFPFVEFDSGNSFSSCLCGTEISHGYQVLDSSCKGDCSGGSNCAGGNGGAGCCGRLRYNSIYLNPDLVGCYEAPIPSASFVAGAPEQTYSEPAGGPTTVGHTATTAPYSGPPVVATNPPSIPPLVAGYYNLGCWQRTAANAPIISGGEYISSTMTVEACVDTCFLFYNYASLTNETSTGFTCRCGNTFGANNGQQPAASCHQLCPGNAPPQTYEYCGGVAVNEQIFGPQSATSSGSSTTTSTTISSSTRLSTSSQSPTTSSISSSQISSSSSSTTLSSSSQTISSQTSSSSSFSASSSSSSTSLLSSLSYPSSSSSQSSSISTSSASSSSSQTSTTTLLSSSTPTSSTQQTSSSSSSSTSSTSSTSNTIASSSTSTQTSGSQSQVSSSSSSSTSTSTSTAGLDCQPDNCLRQAQQSSAALAAFCATYTTSVQTTTTGLPSYVSQCSSTPSRISSACSCVVTNSAPTTSGSTVSSSTLTSTISSTLLSSPTQSSSSPSSTSSLTTSPTSIITSTGTFSSSTIQSTTTSTSTSATGLDCQPDNCLRQFEQSSAVTPFCATYTASVQTGTIGLPDYVSQCSSTPSRISSACSCVVTSSSASSPSSTPNQSSSSSITSSIASTTNSAATPSTTSSSVPPIPSTSTSSTSLTTATTPANPPQGCSPDNCYRQFEESSAVTPFCETYTTALQTDTTGLPPYVSQCQSMPARISSACSCVVTGGALPTTTMTTSTTSTTTTTAIAGPTGTTTTTQTSSTSTLVTTSTPANPLQGCSPDNCARQFLASSAVTAFCETYTTTQQTDTTGLPPYVSQCQSIPSRISSACSCYVTGGSPPTTTVITSSTSTISTTLTTVTSTETTSPTESSSATATVTLPVQNCSPDNCYRQFVESSAVTSFCETYTTALQTDTTGLPPFVSQCQSMPSRISSACSCVVTDGPLPSTPVMSSPPTTSTSATISPIQTTSSPDTNNPTSTPTSPAQNCSPDDCLRQFEEEPAITPFCATYTTAVQTDTTGLPTFVSQCQSMPTRISSACSCVVPPQMSTSTDQPSPPPTSETSITTSESPTTTPPPPAQNCSPDNCLRQFSQSLSDVSTFCSTYTTAVETDTTALPPFVSQCSSDVSRVSSACSCVVTPTNSQPYIPSSPPPSSPVSQSYMPSLPSASTPAPTFTSMPPTQDCSPDNCLRELSQSLSNASTFCSTYTTAVETDTTALPPFVSQCSNDVSRISSACSCVVTPAQSYIPSPPPTTSPGPIATTAPPVDNCSPDNCLRQFSQSFSDVSTFCATYTTAIVTDTTGLPPFVSQCSSDTSRVSSACSCIVAPPTSQPISTPPPTITSAPSPSPTPPAQNCAPDNCLRQYFQSLSEASTFCATYTTSLETETTGLPPFVSQCSSIPYRVSSACSCIAPPPTFSPSTPLSASSMVIASTTLPPVLDCQPDNCLRQYSRSYSYVSNFCATYTTGIETDTTGLPTFVSQCSSDISRVSSACSCIVPPPITETSQGTNSPFMPSTTTANSTVLQSSPTSSTSPTPSNSPLENVPAILNVQLGNLGYYQKRQTSQSYIASGGTVTKNCAMSTDYTLIGNQLFINGTIIVSANPYDSYEAFGALNGLGTITTTFAIDGNNLLSWHNASFVDDQAYFCLQGSQVYALFSGLNYADYPPDCEIVSLIAIPASYCQNGVIVNGMTQSTGSSTIPASNGQSISATGTSTGMGTSAGTVSETGITTSEGSGGYAPSLPSNFYSTAPSGLACVPTEYTWTYGSMTGEPVPTYARRGN